MPTQVVNSVFEKALAEPGFSPVYADFCVKVGSQKQLTDDEGQVQSFKRLILNQCQQEFEQEDAKSKIDEELTDAQRTLSIAKQKQRMLGMIRFIGELFIRDMIKVGIMNICVNTLLGDIEEPEEEKIEALCKLLITVGNAMEKKKQRDELNKIFEQLAILTQNKKVSSRLRFMVQDIIDLRRDGWKGRLTSDINLKKLGSQGGGGDDGEKKRQDARAKKSASDSMRAPAALMGGKKFDRFAAPNRTPVKEDEEGFSAAPLKRGKGGRAAPQDRGLKQDARAPRDESPKPNTPNGKRGGKGYQPASNARAKEEIEKKKPKPTARTLGGGSAFGLLISSSDEDAKSESEDEEEDEDNEGDAEEETPEVDKEQQEKVQEAILGILKEYLRTNDAKEALECIGLLSTKTMHYMIVGRGVDVVLEKSDKDRESLKTLFEFLAKEKVLTSEHFEEGFKDVLEFVEDLIIDIPMCVDHLAFLFAPLMVAGTLSFAYLGTDACEPIKASGKLAQLSKLVFVNAEKSIGEEAVLKMVNKANLDLTALSKHGDMAYLKDLPYMML
jgi:translation initiation factor 4G